MLSTSENDLLCRVSAGTPMGDLFRQYWLPALRSDELPSPDCPPMRLRLLGENLIAFRTTSGAVGLIQNACPHRGASMFFGRNEEEGLRCVYHGWKFEKTGACVDMPSEPAESNFKNKVRITSYPTHESGGVIWTYMGPKETMTGFRDFGTDAVPREEWRAAKMYSTCNWVQAMEGNMDTAHISWLHQYFGLLDTPDDGSDVPGYPSNAMSWKFWAHDRAPRLAIDETWYGYRYAGLRTTPNGHTHARISAYCIPYTTVVSTIPYGTGGGLFVPIDDETCWRWNFTMGSMAKRAQHEVFRNGSLVGPSMPANYPYAGPGGLGGNATGQRPTTPFFNGIVPRNWTAENDYQINRDAQRTTLYTGIENFVSQDLMVTESAGAIWDRSLEHLGTTDKSIITLRRILIDAA